MPASMSSGPLSYILGRSRVIRRSRKTGRKNRSRNTNTYAFLIRIIEGVDYTGPGEVETIALYNESCNYNYISARFARKLRTIGSDIKDGIDGDLTLVWVCEALGRYRQRSVFWIAEDADWDLLFGFEKDFNTPEDLDNQFQCGINNGTLTTEFPKKSFQVGIEDDYLLPVGESTSGPGFAGGVSSRMPSLADIKIQLAVPLASSPERKRKHDERRALNTYIPHHKALRTECYLDADQFDPAETVVFKTMQDETVTVQSVPVAMRIPEQSDNSVFKGTKRVRQEQQTASPTAAMEDLPRSPKIRNGKSICSCRCIAGDLQPGQVSFEGNATKSEDIVSNTTPEQINKELSRNSIVGDRSLLEQRCEDSSEVLESTPPTRRSTTSTEDELLFSGMDRPHSPCGQNLSRESSSISLISNESGITPKWKESVTTLAAGCDEKPPVKNFDQKLKRRRRSRTQSTGLSTTADLTDKKFNEFWKWDEEEGNWCHFDESENATIWYKAPPWSTLSAVVREPDIYR